MLYRRRILDHIEKVLNKPEVIILTGMRRVGKTTLYKIIFSELKTDNKLFIDLENPFEQKIFEENDYNNILLNFKELGLKIDKKMYVFIDEIQAMPMVVKAIKYLYDKYHIKFFLTGSSSFYLKNMFPESLSGRKFIFELYPLDFREFLIFNGQDTKFESNLNISLKNMNKIFYNKKIKLFDEYLEYGGFPEVVLSHEKEIKHLKLKDIFKSYFEKDVRLMADFRHINLFRDLILLLMQRIGSNLEISKISSELGLSRDTVYSFLSFLENTYFIHFVSPYTKSIDREISGTKKIYLCDTGFLNSFSRVSEGSLFENSVFLNLKKYGNIHYYKKRTGGEIDFIIDKKFAVEVKLNGTKYDLQNLEKQARNAKIKRHIVISKNLPNIEGIYPALYL